MTIHPKTGGAAIGAALGVLLVAIANAIHGVAIPQGVTDAISAFLPVLGAYLAPAPDTPAAAAPAPAPVAVVPAAPATRTVQVEPGVTRQVAPADPELVASIRALVDKLDPPAS